MPEAKKSRWDRGDLVTDQLRDEATARGMILRAQTAGWRIRLRVSKGGWHCDELLSGDVVYDPALVQTAFRYTMDEMDRHLRKIEDADG